MKRRSPPRSQALVWSPFKAFQVGDISCEKLWLSHIAAVALIEVKAETDPDTRATLARILRAIGDTCAQLGRSLPVVGILSGLRERTVETWSSDQDWHRGDFALTFWNRHDDDAERHLGEILRVYTRGIRESFPSLPKLRPLDREGYVQNLRRQMEALPSTGLRDRLLTRLVESIELGGVKEEDLEEWIGEILERARKASATQPDEGS